MSGSARGAHVHACMRVCVPVRLHVGLARCAPLRLPTCVLPLLHALPTTTAFAPACCCNARLYVAFECHAFGCLSWLQLAQLMVLSAPHPPSFASLPLFCDAAGALLARAQPPAQQRRQQGQQAAQQQAAAAPCTAAAEPASSIMERDNST